MTELNTVIDSLVGDRELVLRFFAFFSRFEYSLKRTGFLKAGDKAEPDWNTYANSLRGHFGTVKHKEFCDAVAFLLKDPPKTQIVSGTNLDWIDTVQGNGEHHERYILRLVNTVRNNLFHGGKYPVPIGSMSDVGRNRKLLEAAMSVLTQCLVLSAPVRAAFEETA